MSLSPDLMVAMLWLHTINKITVESSRLGILNLHGGDLPRYRGNACQTWAILNEEKKIGVSVHLMEGDSLDCGPVVLKEHISVTSSTTVGELIGKINAIGPSLVLEAVKILLQKKDFAPEVQDNAGALHCYPRIPRDGEINWDMSAREIHKLIRAAGKPYPGAYSYYEDHRDNNKIKKLNIDNAHIENHISDYCAVTGHILKMDGGRKWGVVCGDKKLLVIDQMRIDQYIDEHYKTYI